MKNRRSLRRFSSLMLALAILTALLASPAGAAPAAPSVTADSAIVMDYLTGDVLYAKDADTMRVPASMTKVMTAYIIFEELEAGRLTLDTLVPVSAANAALSRNSAYPMAVPLTAGASYTVNTLLKLILIPSASASCVVMAEFIAGSEAAFVARMNETAKRLGMEAAYENSHGALVHYITARSQAILIREFIQRFPAILDYTSMTEVVFNGVTYSNTNKLLPGKLYAHPGVDGFKTGTIAAAGYCLSATAVRDGRRVITVVMHSDNDAARHNDSIALIEYGFSALALRAVIPDLTGHWAREEVEELYDMGAELHLTENYRYRPDDAITRAEFTALLYTAMEAKNLLPAATAAAPVFTDTAGHWAESCIAAAAARGLVSGLGDGSFNPDSPITRQELMYLTDSLLDLPDENGLAFTDVSDVSLWALHAAARVTAAGLFTGTGGKLLPLDNTDRAEGAALVLRLLDYLSA